MSSKTFAPKYREKVISLARSGRSYESLAREFEPSAKTIREWVKQAHRKESSEDRDLARRTRELERENARLKQECEILRKAQEWFDEQERVNKK